MTTTNISFYSTVADVKSQETIPFDIFLENIRVGTWQDYVLPLRKITDKKQREAAKKKVPSVTIAGMFSERTDSAQVSHSGYIAIDIDNCEDPEEYKSLLCPDKYVVAAFTSISGRGLCLIFKVNPAKHRLAHDGILEYLFNTYGVIADPTSVNVSRARFVSFDPDIYIAQKAETFTLYPKIKEPKKIERVIYTADDFGEMLRQIQEQGVNLCENYHDWLRIGFSISSKFGEEGRQAFHAVSQFSSKYTPRSTDKQYDAILKRTGASKGRDVTISTFYYYCKQAGLNIYSERTRVAAYSASHGKKGGLTQQQVVENLQKFEGISGAEDIVKQVFESTIELNEDSLLDELEIWVRQNYSLKRNEVTRYIENDGTPMQQEDFNTIYIRAKKIFETLSFDLVDRLIRSKFVSTYNPFQQFIKEHLEDEPQEGLIDKLFSTISTKDAEYLKYFGKKWFVSIFSSIHGEHSPLMFVLCGAEQNTGKTEWFRRLLPPELKTYYAESKLDAGKDDEILMTQKLIIMDDEMGGKSKKENKRLKELTSKQTFSLREPYGRNNVDLNRLAVLCGTTNDNELLSDPTGNRRIIPIWVNSINQREYNAIDKTALFMEGYRLWKAGFEWKLSKADVEYLGVDSGLFEVTSLEGELVSQFFKPGKEHWTATEVKVKLEQRTQQRLSLDRIGKELKRLGFEQKHIKSNGTTKRIYCAVETAPLFGTTERAESIPEDDGDLPF